MVLLMSLLKRLFHSSKKITLSDEEVKIELAKLREEIDREYETSRKGRFLSSIDMLHNRMKEEFPDYPSPLLNSQKLINVRNHIKKIKLRLNSLYIFIVLPKEIDNIMLFDFSKKMNLFIPLKVNNDEKIKLMLKAYEESKKLVCIYI